MQHLAAGLLLGLAAALLCLGAASRRRERPVPVAGLAVAAAAAAGLAVTGAPADPALGWPALAAVTAVVAAALASFDRRWGRLGLPPALLAVTAAGIWVCVPDVEGPLVLLGAVVPMALLGRPGPLASRRPGAAAMASWSFQSSASAVNGF